MYKTLPTTKDIDEGSKFSKNKLFNSKIAQKGEKEIDYLKEIPSILDAQVSKTWTSNQLKALFAMYLGHLFISAVATGKAIKSNFRVLKINDQAFPTSDTNVTRSTLEVAITIQYFIALNLSKSDEIHIGIDECSKSKRSFVQIEIGGRDIQTNHHWNTLGKLYEVPEHTAQTQLELILKMFLEIQGRQLKMGLQPTEIYNIDQIIYDNTNVNTGNLNGLGVLLERERIRLYEQVNTYSLLITYYK